MRGPPSGARTDKKHHPFLKSCWSLHLILLCSLLVVYMASRVEFFYPVGEDLQVLGFCLFLVGAQVVNNKALLNPNLK